MFSGNLRGVCPAENVMSERFCFGIDLETGSPGLDALRRRLADAARLALPDVRAGRFDAADARVLAVERDIQTAVMLGAMYTEALRESVKLGERRSRPAHFAALFDKALHWRHSAYPEPHTAVEAENFSAGRDADRAQLEALIAG
jgi:hypothetical protein